MSFAVGSLVRARGREWVVLPESNDQLLLARPLGGTDLEIAGIHTALEPVESATFALPTAENLGDHRSCRLLWDAVRLGFRSSAGPFRSFARINVEPRPYQLVPLLMALRLPTVRLLVADDVGVGKTIEACLIVREMLDRGEITRFSVLCPPQLAEQWQRELRTKFHIDAERVLPSTINRLERQTRADQSLFEVFPYTVVSTDFIKSIRRREQFILQCPEMIIVDEAHTCALGGTTGRQQRHDLITRLAADPKRHVLLVTATPHSGNENAFRSLLSLLDGDFTNLPEELGGDENRAHRERLARHMVQRRRADIRTYMHADTPFPDRKEKEENYKLSPAYQKFLVHVLNYARQQVETDGEKRHQRVRWWSMLALLRAMASSPAAAAATLRSRAAVADAETPEQVDEIGKQSVLDLADDEAAENLDLTPGADTEDTSGSTQSDRRRLLDMAKEADALAGEPDTKLLKATELVKGLLTDGFHPIVFCRFIHTAEYVAEWFRKKLPKDVTVKAVTGSLPPEDREDRVEKLGEAPKRILVCTDCLSEGINLQEYFNAVVHYDLSWNPTRHEQRDGRVDRYGQKSPEIRVVTYYGLDNLIDGMVLDVLIKKHRSIRSSLGISVPVPVDTDQVIEAIFKGLLLRHRDADASQMSLFSIDDLVPVRKKVHDEWQSVAEREAKSRTVFAQHAMKVDEVAAELAAVREAIGSGTDVARFVRTGMAANGAAVTEAPKNGLHVELGGLSPALRDQLGLPGKALEVRFELPTPDGIIHLTRTHPIVEKLAGFTLDTALDPLQKGVARRAGVTRTKMVSRRTTLLLLRLRYQIITGKGPDARALLAEDSVLVGFSGSPQNPEWLPRESLEPLLAANADANTNPDMARDTIEKVIAAVPELQAYLDKFAVQHGEGLLEAHTRVRRATQARGLSNRIEAKLPPDILGIYVYLPATWRRRSLPPVTTPLRNRPMPTPQANLFATVRTEGAILPPDLLQLIAAESRELDGLTPAAYHLIEGERFNEAATRSFNRLLTAWANFKLAVEKLAAEDPATSATREKLLLPLFSELGYGRLSTTPAVTIEDKTYAISHGWQKTPIHLVGCRVDLDTRAAGVAGASKASPHSLLQEFLNRSPAHLWGFVANGYKLRVLRDTRSLARQAFVEFDLQQMFEGQNYADFKLLWLVCHQSRVEGDRPEQCLLEKWSQVAIQRGTRLQEKLRAGVEAAIETLGRGFLAHPANKPLLTRLRDGTLDKQDYYRQLLRQVYRFLFLFVAEDRDVLLLPDEQYATARATYNRHYSTRRLRDLAGSLRGSPHPDLYRALKLVFAKLNITGCPQLALPALGSLLWSDAATPDLDTSDLANRDLLNAVHKLAFTQDDATKTLRPVDYRNLGSEEFGSVYEGLLELHPDINSDAATFALSTSAGNERKTSGSFYTPSSLVNCLLDSALDPVIAAAIKGKSAAEAEKALLALKICDPASGSGHFLIAAAHRLAKRLAAVRTGEEEPAPDAYRHALRDVIRHCIYGVDLNPMAVELCRVALWMESLEPGKPLSFLEAHIKVGNSLLGTTPALLAQGIPDDAFEPIEGDDKAVCRELKKRNKKEREAIKAGQTYLFDVPLKLGNMPEVLAQIGAEGEDSVADVQRHQQIYAQAVQSAAYENARFLADAWCAAFLWPKDKSAVAPHAITEKTFRDIERSPHNFPPNTAEHQETRRLAEQYTFFHWHLEFPDVFALPAKGSSAEAPAGWSGGFGVVLGNPPWERIKLQEDEWFADAAPEIAAATTANQRRAMIVALEQTNPELHRWYCRDSRKADGESHFVMNSSRYPLMGRGDVNTYTLFAETNRELLAGHGRMGCVLPSGIATDDTTKLFFQKLVDGHSLVSLYSFDNRDGIFPAVKRSTRFCLLTITSNGVKWNEAPRFVFYARDVADLSDPQRLFTLSADEIALLAPNTRTCPVFKCRRDADLVKCIYKRLPVLVQETPVRNEWGLIIRRVFDMNKPQVLAVCTKDSTALDAPTPMREAKLMGPFDHRGQTYEGGKPRSVVSSEHGRPDFVPTPRYWLEKRDLEKQLPEAWTAQWLLVWQDITDVNTMSRSVLCCVLPRVGTDFTLRVGFPSHEPAVAAIVLAAALNSFVLDYTARQVIGGIHLSDYILKQLPIPMPSMCEERAPWDDGRSFRTWIRPRVIELSYTSWELSPFAADCGYSGPPFIWDEDRRFLIRCELDAAYFHLYGISREDADYILSTFPIVERREREKYGTYRTRDTILEIYDAMATAIQTGQPYQTRLNPPPGPPADAAGNFIPVAQWATWPSHIHPPKPRIKTDVQQLTAGDLMLNIYAALYTAAVPVEIENLRRMVVLMLNEDLRKWYLSGNITPHGKVQNRVSLPSLRDLLRSNQRSGNLLADGDIDGIAQIRPNPDRAPTADALKAIGDIGINAFHAAEEAMRALTALRGRERLLDDDTTEVSDDVTSNAVRGK